MKVYFYASIYAYKHTYMKLYFCASIYACKHTCMKVYLYESIYAYTHTYMQVYVHTSILRESILLESILVFVRNNVPDAYPWDLERFYKFRENKNITK